MSRTAAHRALLLAPALAVMILFFVLPLGMMAYVSVLQRGPYGGVVWDRYTLEGYAHFVVERDLLGRPQVNFDYLVIFGRSALLAGVATVVALVVALPTALWMAFLGPRARILVLFLVTVPFWTNILVRNYAWILILRTDGVLDSAVQSLGWTGFRNNLLYTPVATCIGLVYSFLPFMILPIFVSLDRIDRRLIEAAYDLGADRLRALTRVVLPLAGPGIAAGVILVFIPGLGAFISPTLLGGAKSFMIGNLIQEQFGAARNWPFGAALSLVLLALVAGALFANLRWRRRLEAPS